MNSFLAGWLVIDWLLADYWLTIGRLLADYRMAIGWLFVAVYCLLADYWLTIDWLLAGYWLSIGSADFWLVNYWVGRLHLADFPAAFLVFVMKHSRRWGLHIGCTKMFEHLFQAGMDVLNHFFCKISMSYE